MPPETFQYLPFDLVTRSQWGAHDPDEEGIELPTPVGFVIHTYTDSEPCFSRGECIKRVKHLQARDLSLGLSDIRYNFLIGEDSSLYEGRGWKVLPDLNEDFPHLYEKSIEIAHIGFTGEPSDEILHIAQQLFRYGVMKKYLRSNFKYFKVFKEIPKDEEHYGLDASGNLELTCYKRGRITERDDSDEYRVLADVAPGRPHYWLERDDDDPHLPGFEKAGSIDYAEGVKMDASLLSDEELEELTREKAAIGGEPALSTVTFDRVEYIQNQSVHDDPLTISKKPMSDEEKTYIY